MHYTNSETAEKIVNDFSIYLKKFKKVMPIEYKRVLEKTLKKIKLKIILRKQDKCHGKSNRFYGSKKIGEELS